MSCSTSFLVSSSYLSIAALLQIQEVITPYARFAGKSKIYSVSMFSLRLLFLHPALPRERTAVNISRAFSVPRDYVFTSRIRATEWRGLRSAGRRIEIERRRSASETSMIGHTFAGAHVRAIYRCVASGRTAPRRVATRRVLPSRRERAHCLPIYSTFTALS